MVHTGASQGDSLQHPSQQPKATSSIHTHPTKKWYWTERKSDKRSEREKGGGAYIIVEGGACVVMGRGGAYIIMGGIIYPAKVLSCDGKEDLDSGLVGEELSTVIGGLAREGLLIRVTEEDGRKPSMEERYEVSINKGTRYVKLWGVQVLVEEKHLCPSIVEFIKQKSLRTGQAISVFLLCIPT